MRSAIAAVVLVSGVLIPRALAAQEALVRLTLDEAIARGLATSHRLADVSARGDAVRANVGSRHAALLPQVAAQAGYLRTNHVDEFGIVVPNGQLRVIYPDIPDNYRARLDLQWPIYTAGRADALERSARAEADAAGDDLATARADLRLEITRAYWALVTAGEAVRVVDESLKRIEAQLQDVRNRFDAGLLPPNDVSSTEAQRSRQRMLTVQARSARDIAESDLARLTGIGPGTPIEPVAELSAPEPPGAPMSDLVALARQQRSERAALLERAAAAGERARAARAGNKPVVAVGGGVDYASPNARIFPRTSAWNQSWDAGINVNWPLFDGGRTKADTAEATANRRAIDERLADFDATIAAEVRQRATDLASSRAAIDAAGDAVRAAADAQRVVRDRFKAGVATSTDVLDAQVALLQAELDRTQAIAGARLAEARLARALGQ